MKRVKEGHFDNMMGEEFNDGRNFVMDHWDEYDKSFWKGVINALRSQGIREAQKRNKSKQLVESFLKDL